ncbi:MAG: 23S rRNA (guanosine(2251)-2'-O)-methyltransferase RlmB, partial [Actinobacteria bacterium]|nr:23S rRNA (guanosine(2251)-2'-O)-methyltransferase RlmB [Actinomycetota bacterium]
MAFKNARGSSGKKTVGSGGKNRKSLKGKGPTPKAKDR